MYGACFVLLILCCSLLRLLYLTEFPPQVHNDELATGVWIHAFQQPSGPWALKGTSYGGHPAFGFWLSSIPSKLTGVVTLENIRVASGVLGILSLVFMGLAVRDGAGRRASLLFLLFALPFHLHVHYSRTAFQYTHAIFALAVFFWIAVRFWRAPSYLNTMLLGLGIGLCLLVYSAAHVMPLALAATLVIRRVFPPHPEPLPTTSISAIACMCVCACGGFVLAFGLQLHEWILHGYGSRASTQFILTPQSRAHIESSVGHSMTDVEIFVDSFWRTLRFFYSGDSAGQYSFQGSPLGVVGASLASLGLIALLHRALARDFLSLLTILSAAGTVAGSMLMVEANFSPHLVIFSLLMPLAMAIGFDVVARPLSRRWLPIAVVIAIAIGAWWSWWNYNYYLKNARDDNNRPYTWLLLLPIDTFAVRSLQNFTSYREDLGHEFFHSVFPHATRANHEIDDIQRAFASLTETRAQGQCPCLWVVNHSDAPTFAESLTSHAISFQVFRRKFDSLKLDLSAFLIQSEDAAPQDVK